MAHVLLLTDVRHRVETAVARDALARLHSLWNVTELDTSPRPDRASAAAGTVFAADLRIGDRPYSELYLRMGRAGARWAAIPVVTRRLLAEEEKVVVVPCEAMILGPLDFAAAGSGSIRVLPRRVGYDGSPMDDELIPEIAAFESGGAEAALDAWITSAWSVVDEKREHSISVDPWTDTPWADFAEVSGDCLRIAVRDYSVHPLNATGQRAGDVALASFPDFDPRFPWRFGEEGGADSSESWAGSRAWVRPLCEERALELLDAGWTPVPADRVIGRLSHSRALAEAVRSSSEPVPNPYDPGNAGAFMAWLTDSEADTVTGVSRYADLVWAARADLASAFPHVRGEHARLFTRWMWTSGLRERVTHVEFLPDAPPALAIPRRAPVASKSPGDFAPQFGVNLVGYHAAEAGLGVAVRRVARALDASGIPWKPLSYDRTGSRQRAQVGVAAAAADSETAPFWFHLVLVTPEQLGQFGADVGTSFFDDHYTVGLWYWETDVMPRSHRLATELVDEVWGATGYLRDVFAAHTTKPVLRMPVPLEFGKAPRRSDARATMRFDDRFTFLFSFDFLSVVRRKNPLGLIDAYLRAFPDPGTTRLILKSINGDQFPDERARLTYEIADRPDIELWDRYLESDERLALVAAADCYVSLHRSEGLGLTMAEAMAAGTPVIASAYSGNLDFMDGRSALLVGGDEITIGPDNFYPADGRWFDPDLDEAAGYMVRIVGDEALRADLTQRGRDSIARFSSAAAAEPLLDRLDQLWATRPNC